MSLLPLLLKSRRFQTALIGLVMIIAVHFFPELEGRQTEISEAILVIVGLIVGGYTVDHASYNLGLGKAEVAASATVALANSNVLVEAEEPQVYDDTTGNFRPLSEANISFDPPDLA
jgi:hypothetical protein